MKKIMIFLILALLFTNPIYADENTTNHIIIYTTIDPDRVDNVLVYDTPMDSDNASTVEKANSTQNNILQENTTLKTNTSSMENNTQSINITQNNTQSQNNNVSNNSSVVNSMYNTANPLFVLLIACILIPMVFYRKRK